ncbi:zinc-binding dehydrogenase, partial [Streptomyces microflavus]
GPRPARGGGPEGGAHRPGQRVFSYGGRYAFVRPDAADLAQLAELAEQGIVTVHVDRVFPLEQAADAYRLNQEGRTRGKIVVTVDWEG